MKLKNIAKASLALGILTTGMITTTAQPVKAESMDSSLTAISNDTQKLKDYYTGTSFDYKNLKGYREGNIATFIFNSQQIDVNLTENEKNKFEDGNGIQNVDVFVVREGSGIIKGHTSVKGKVALSINNKFINLGDSTDVENRLTEDQGKTRYQGIWKHIDDKGYFEFDFKRKPYDNLKLNPDDNVSLTFLPNDEEEALKPIIFKTKVTSFDNIESAITSYNPKNVNKVTTLTNVKEDLVVEDIYGFEYKSEQGRGIPQNNSHSTKEIKGKTKFANAVVKVDSELGEGQEFPDLQVNENGEFTFNSFDAGYRLYNGEKLNFTVVDPITGDLLSQGFVSKNIDVYESPEQKKEREFDEKLESIPAYYQLHGDKIIGFDTEGGVSTWFDALDKKELEKVLRQY